jgi:dipeptidyl aminopeptidase/acylaminoacyl peptidase
VQKVDLAFDEPGGTPILSPDGSRVAYLAEGRLFIRRLDSFETTEVPAAGDIQFPAWSPDGDRLVFVRQERAWTVSAEGGSAAELAAVPRDVVGSGGMAWTDDGRIVVAGSDTTGLWEIPAGGGSGRELHPLDRGKEVDFHEIAPLPGGGVVFTVHRSSGSPDTIALLAGGVRKVVLQLPGEGLLSPVYSATGHLHYERLTTNPGIWAVPFSLERLEVTGAPFLAVPGGATPTVARNGSLCFFRREQRPIELVRVSRSGSVEPVAELPGTRTSMVTSRPVAGGYRRTAGLRLSPDGGRVAVATGAQLIVHDLARGTSSTLASNVFDATRPVWSADGERLLFGSAGDGRSWNLTARRADGVGEQERLSNTDELQLPLALSPDGRHLVFVEGTSPERGNLFVRDLASAAAARTLLPVPAWGVGASFSPDGRWLAHESPESGRTEIYARPFPGGDARVQLSTGGGDSPVWTRSGEVLYHAAGAIHSVSVAVRGGVLEAAKPVRLFETGEARLVPVFDVTPDGRQLLMIRARGAERVSLVQNWPAELRKLAGRASGGGK